MASKKFNATWICTQQLLNEVSLRRTKKYIQNIKNYLKIMSVMAKWSPHCSLCFHGSRVMVLKESNELGIRSMKPRPTSTLEELDYLFLRSHPSHLEFLLNVIEGLCEEMENAVWAGTS